MHVKSTLLMSTAITAAILVSMPSLVLAQAAPATPTAAPTPEETATEEAAARETPELIVVTANRRNERATRIPYNITAIGEEQLREQNITDIKDLLQENIAISAPQNGARFNDSVTVRGLNVSPVNANNLDYFVRSTLSYYLDDTPLPNIGFRIKDVARTESLIGPQGTLYGAGAMGGVIRYITNQPKLGEYEGRIGTSIYQIQGGGLSNDTDFMLNLPVGETLAVRLSYSRLDDAGYTDRVSNPPWFTPTRALTNNPNPAQNLYKDDDWTKTEGGRIAIRWAPVDSFSAIYSYQMQDQLAHGTTGASLLPLRVANAVTQADRDLFFSRPGPEFRGSPSTPLSCEAAVPKNCAFIDERATPYAVNDQTIVSPYEEFSDRSIEMHTLSFNLDLGFAGLTSSTAYYTDEKVGQADYFSQGFAFYCDISFTDLGGCMNPPASRPGNRSALLTFSNNAEGIVHETRLVSQGEGPFSWIAGVFYTETKSSSDFTEIIPDPDGSGPGLGLDALLDVRFGNGTVGSGKAIRSPNPNEGYYENFSSEYSELAVFGELTYQITPRWRAMVGGRVFNYEDVSTRTLVDYAGAFANENNTNELKDTAVSYFRFNTAYDITPNLLAYFTAAQGFRRGGANPFRNLPATGGGPIRTINPEIATYGPDSIDTFELGVKGSVLDRRLYIEANVYQTYWKDVQTYFSQSIDGFPVNGTINGPDATARGFEFSSRYRFNDNWSVTYKTSLAESEWDETREYCTYVGGTSPTPGSRCSGFYQTGRGYDAGGTLGGSPEGRHDFGVRYTRELADGSRVSASLSGRANGEVQSDRCDTPTCENAIYKYPAYTDYNLSVGWRRGGVNASFWVDNLTNVDVPVSNQAAGILGYRVITLTPVTVGLNLGYRW